MATLIKNIEAKFYDNHTTNVKYVKSITSNLQKEDYIDITGFIGFLQNFSKTEETYLLETPIEFGLKNQYNIPLTTLTIDY
jgi:hypothetical protein